jgi:hypothetical protein
LRERVKEPHRLDMIAGVDQPLRNIGFGAYEDKRPSSWTASQAPHRPARPGSVGVDVF